MSNTILLIEDDNELQTHLKKILVDHGYAIHVTSQDIEAIEYLKKEQPGLVIIDLGLVILSKETKIQKMLKGLKYLPIIFLAEKNSIVHISQRFNLDAEDFIQKPMKTNELLDRIKEKICMQPAKSTLLKVADLELDSRTLEVHRSGKSIQLTPQEFKLLQYLMNNKGRILTREMILSKIWLYSSDVETRVIDVYMGYLRKKIDYNYPKKLFYSIRGFGYVIKE
jgi:DNA-binding response OmpR family regulator